MGDEKLKVYAEAEIPGKLAEQGLTSWYLEDGWIRRVYKTDGWPTTLMLVNAIGYCAEAAYHHPDLAVTTRASGASAPSTPVTVGPPPSGFTTVAPAPGPPGGEAVR